MTNITRVSREELTAIEILDILEAGGRVVIELSVLGNAMNVVIRQHNGTYYCDTPMKLLRHDSQDELRECLEKFRLARPVNAGETEVSTASA